MRARKNGGFTVRQVTVKELKSVSGQNEKRTFAYSTFRLTGWLDGQRIRKQFLSRDEALGEKQALEIRAANLNGDIRARNTRLTIEQLAEAEAAYSRLGGRSLSQAVEWYLDTYRPPVTVTPLAVAETAFLEERTLHVRPLTLRDYRLTLQELRAFSGAKAVHEVQTRGLLDFLTSRKVGKKRWNNLRGDLHAFFEFCRAMPRQWTRENPVTAIPKFRISRGVPQIVSAKHIGEVFAFLEKYTGETGRQPAGFLVPYFALATFAGLRPSVDDGEIVKIGQLGDPARVVDLDLGVIRITPEIAKTNHVRRIKIRPNLAEWLARYPLRRFPINVPHMRVYIANARRACGLAGKDDILRHTFISMHVGKFRSLGEAALEAGNSESIIRKHYLEMVSEAEAESFWSIRPAAVG